jgi:hypothetical protein
MYLNLQNSSVFAGDLALILLYKSLQAKKKVQVYLLRLFDWVIILQLPHLNSLESTRIEANKLGTILLL